jgi:hypothetical protein
LGELLAQKDIPDIYITGVTEVLNAEHIRLTAFLIGKEQLDIEEVSRSFSAMRRKLLANM